MAKRDMAFKRNKLKGVLAIILARKGSKRIKNKHLIVINGKPLIRYTFEYAKGSKGLDDIVCSTDSSEIANLARSSGINVIKRPSKFARDDSHIIEALRYTLLKYREKMKYLPKITVILMGNVPYRATTIEEGLELFHKRNADSVFTACKVLKYHPEWMFKSNKKNRIIFKKTSLNYRCQDLDDWYITTDSFIISDTRRLTKKYPRKNLYSDFGDNNFFVMEEKNATVDIDDIRDLHYFRFLLSDKNKKTKLIYWKKPKGNRTYEKKGIG